MARAKVLLYYVPMKVSAIKGFGPRLVEAMEGAGVSQADLARFFEVTPQAIYAWTKYRRNPRLSIDRWVSLSQKLNVNLEWLALGLGPKERADMNPAVFEMLRRFQQLDPAQQQVIMTTIAALLSHRAEAGFSAGNQP